MTGYPQGVPLQLGKLFNSHAFNSHAFNILSGWLRSIKYGCKSVGLSPRRHKPARRETQH